MCMPHGMRDSWREIIFLSYTFGTWLIKIEVRRARPHNRRALHAAWLIPRACGSRKSHEESQATSEPCPSSRSHTVVLHESTLSPSTESRWSCVIPLLLFATCTLRSPTAEWGTRRRRAQTIPPILTSTNTHRVRFTYGLTSSVPRGTMNTENRSREREENPSAREITHDKSKLRATTSAAGFVRRPRELRANPIELHVSSISLRLTGLRLGPSN